MNTSSPQLSWMRDLLQLNMNTSIILYLTWMRAAYVKTLTREFNLLFD